jgi:hypothetical protein
MSSSADMHTVMKLNILLVVALLITSVIGVTATMQTQHNNRGANLDVTLLDEGFEGGVMPPTGWNFKKGNNDGKWWKIVTYPVHTGTFAAQCPEEGNQQDEWLTTPNINLTYYLGATLDFWCNSSNPIGGTLCDVVVRGPHVVDTTLWSVPYDWLTNEWRKINVDLTGYAGKVINVSWHYYGSWGKMNFNLDDVVVTGKPTTPPPNLTIGKIKGGLMKITAEIFNMNNETGDDGINVTWCINATGNGALQKLIFITNATPIPKIDHNGGKVVVTLSKKTERDHKQIVGFGKIHVIVDADIPDNPRVIPVQKTVDGFVFIIWVFIFPNQ